MSTFNPAAPWVPESPFFADNRQAIENIFQQLEDDFPTTGAGEVLDVTSEGPTSEAMSWMWTRLMGQQHGSSEGLQNKVSITPTLEPHYQSSVDSLHYGPYGFTHPNPANPNLDYTHSLILGGLPQEMVSRLQAARGFDPRHGNVEASTLLVGQRLRWQSAPGERSVQEIYDMVRLYSGADMEELYHRSPWMRLEAQKAKNEKDDWSGPYATELAIGRLCTEAYFRNLIDWDNYGVTIVTDSEAHEQTYDFKGSVRVVPPRSEAVITYDLTDGTKAHILNAKAVARTQGVPRPTSDSQALEVVKLGMITENSERLSVATSLPHIRAGIDIFIRLLQGVPGIGTTEIVSHPWLPDKELLTALGELPATHKADMRIRALLAGKDPDAPELQKL